MTLQLGKVGIQLGDVGEKTWHDFHPHLALANHPIYGNTHIDLYICRLYLCTRLYERLVTVNVEGIWFCLKMGHATQTI